MPLHPTPMNLRLSILASALLACTARPLCAQGIQTGTIAGAVTSADGRSIPGASVSVVSPALQGERTTTADSNGVFALRGLPAGAYAVRFANDGFQPATVEQVSVHVGATVEVSATLSAASTEVVTVVGAAPSLLGSVTASRTVVKAQVDAMPVSRRPVDIAG
mgnify:CR=1 FL=1